MGSGKTSATIDYMNSHPDEKYIYITPYLDEANRIRQSCPSLKFIEPSNKLGEYKFKKIAHTAALISSGRNITTTHQAFKNYSKEMLENIRDKGYTLFIDENVDTMELCEFHSSDLQLAIDAGYISDDNGSYSVIRSEYDGEALQDMFNLFKSRELIKVISTSEKDSNCNVSFYWTLPPELLTAFKDVYVLTYLFSGQSLHHLMKIHNIPFEYIGINHNAGGGYSFGNAPGYVPEYVHNIREMINVLDKDKMNDIGENYHALSVNWFKRDGGCVNKLKNNLLNYFTNINRDVPANRRLWGSYNGSFNKLKGKGYTKSYLAFNAKATNMYKDRDCLAYIANPFMNTNEKTFYKMNGVEVDEEMYALSIMVQWIWRSAIRDGKKINIYIPSRRMRTLLFRWIESLEKGVNMIDLQKV